MQDGRWGFEIPTTSDCPDSVPGRSSPRSGFTLIEVMFAGFVLSVAVLGMLSLVTVGHQVSREAWETGIDKSAVQSKIDEIKELAADDFHAVRAAYDGADAYFDVPLLKHPDNNGGLPKGIVRIEETVAGDPTLLDVEVEVRWWGVAGDQDMVYRTRLCPY